ncbi:hypothetical protein [Variovorax sp. YR752]|uniref:hypothetical protein n=1 Tax=Variovorax sp. YR752 TaxID=1884383 RepID=UPI003137EC09
MSTPLWWLARAALALLLGAALSAQALEAPAGSAAALHARRLELQPSLRSSAFGEPLHLSSKEVADRIEGDVYAEMAHPFETVGAAFRSAQAVCEVMFLHLNVHACRPAEGSGLLVVAGPKRSGASGMTAQMRYTMRTEVDDPSHLRVVLSAPSGPLSTSDYRIVFEAVPIDAGRSFVHFGYSNNTTAAARLAMRIYLATAGREKIGFTVVGKEADGSPRYLRGERASLERNVMRYYFALLAHCSVRSGSPEERMQARLRTWFALTERHAAQLHEYELADYLQEKQRDLVRQAAGK